MRRPRPQLNKGVEASMNEMDADDFAAAMLFFGGTDLSLTEIAESHAEILVEFGEFDPVLLTRTFGALLTVPELQCNCARIEALAHLAATAGNGKRKPTSKLVSRAFAEVGKGPIGSMEDPSEDMFVTSIYTSRGNFRVLEGIWESAGFYLQRFVNVVEKMPAIGKFIKIRESVFALLQLSDAMCARSGLKRWQDGACAPLARLPSNIVAQIRDLEGRITFSLDDLAELHINLDDLDVFLFDPGERGKMIETGLGNTALERYPLFIRDCTVSLVLPTAVSVAIKRFVIECTIDMGLRVTLVEAIGAEYMRLFHRSKIMERGRLAFAPTKHGRMAAMTGQVDEGRYLNLVFVLDTLDEIKTKIGRAHV